MANGLNTYTFINYMKNAKDENGKLAYNVDLSGITGLVTSISLSNKNPEYVITQNGRALTQEELKNLNLGQILSGNYELSARQGVNANLGNKGEDILIKFAEVLGYKCDPDKFKGLNVDEEASAALDKAIEFTKNDCLQKTHDVGNGILTNVANNHIIITVLLPETIINQ